MQLEVVSLGPRAFIVDRFLSDFEAEEIIRLASPGMGDSQVGEGLNRMRKRSISS
jgi:hypothetical protein